MGLLIGTIAVDGDADEADEGEDEGEVDGRPAEDDLLVNEMSLEGGHQGSTHDGHDEEGGSEGGVLSLYVLEGNTVDAGEHDRHEEADTHQRVQAQHSFDADGTEGADRSTDAEDHQQATLVNPFHDVSANETTRQRERHRQDVPALGSGLIDAKVVGILNDKGPNHDLGCHR